MKVPSSKSGLHTVCTESFFSLSRYIVGHYLKLCDSISNCGTVSQIVSQYLKFWDSISNCGTLSQIVRKHLKLWDSISNCGTVSQIVSQYLKFWDSISNCETVSQIVGQHFNLWDSISNYATEDSSNFLEIHYLSIIELFYIWITDWFDRYSTQHEQIII